MDTLYFSFSILLPHFLIIFLFLIVALFSFPENLFFSHFYYISITDSHYTAKHRNKKGSKQNRKPIPEHSLKYRYQKGSIYYDGLQKQLQ